LIQNIVAIVRKNNGKVIANEVTTGIGRTGKWFGYQHYDIEPDMIAVGKGIGNGYPVSAALLTQGIANELQKSTFEYMQGHQNDPLGAAVVREAIQVIRDDDLISEAEKKGEIFLSKLNSLVGGKIVIGIRGRGLMFAIDLANEEISEEIYNELLELGYIVCNRGSFFRIDPPLTITKNEFGKFIGALTTIVASKENFT
jgi:acetylornithine/N-succinyldiaminopimelate aminotransferase